MSGLMVLAAVLLVLILIGQIPVGIGGEYTGSSSSAWARLGPVRIQFWPPHGKKQKEAKPKEATGEEVPARKKADKPGLTPGEGLDYVRELVPIALEAAGQFRKKLSVDQLVLEIRAGASDPADAAMAYGYANAALGALWLPLNEAFHIKDGTARATLDFESESTTVYARGAMSLKVGQIVRLGLVFGWKGLRGFMKVRNMHDSTTKKRKAV